MNAYSVQNSLKLYRLKRNLESNRGFETQMSVVLRSNTHKAFTKVRK